MKGFAGQKRMNEWKGVAVETERQIQEIFAAALEKKPGAAREEYLTAACQGEPGLRQHAYFAESCH